MMRSLWTAKTGMEAQQQQLDAISHNLANAATNGYKRSHVVFEDLMYQNLRQAGANSSEETTLPTGLQVGLGARAVANARSFTQGNLQQTGNTLDIAVKGYGFFQIQMPDGSVAYTRDGAFQVDAQGRLVTNNGFVVQPGITIPANAQSVTIAADASPDDVRLAVESLVAHLMLPVPGGQRRHDLEIETIDGAAATRSPHAAAFVAAGYRREGLSLRKAIDFGR